MEIQALAELVRFRGSISLQLTLRPIDSGLMLDDMRFPAPCFPSRSLGDRAGTMLLGLLHCRHHPGVIFTASVDEIGRLFTFQLATRRNKASEA